MICVGCDADTEKVALAIELDKPIGGETWHYQLTLGNMLSRTQQSIVEGWLEHFSLRILPEIVNGNAVAHFIAEDQYVWKNWDTALKLAAIRGRVENSAARSHFLVHPPVKADEWQRDMLGIRRGTKREVRKAISCERASLISGQNITDHNIADAMGIAAWLKARVKTDVMLQRGVITGAGASYE